MEFSRPEYWNGLPFPPPGDLPGGKIPRVFPRSSVDKEYACNSGDPSSIPGSGRYSGEGNGYPLQYSCLENPMDREAWWATIHGVTRIGHNLGTEQH